MRPVAVGLVASEVGPDSALVLTLEPSLPSYGIPVDAALWDTVGVEVSNEDGLPIPGALKPSSGFSIALWQPEIPLETGTYHLSVHIQPEDECPAIDEALSFDVVASPVPTPSTEITVEGTLRVQTIPALANYVCCDGATPFMPSPPGSGCLPQPPTVDWTEGYCAAIEEDHVLDVAASLEADAAGILTLRETTTGARPTTGSLSLALTLDAQDCLEFEVLDLRSGTLTTSSWCPEETLALGRLPREALEAELSASCLGPAYQCERFDRCTPWPDDPREPGASSSGDDSDGAPASDEPQGCSTGSPGAYALALLLLLGLGYQSSRKRRIRSRTR